ncbi:sialyltransferase-like protein 4 [Panicum miliaceum]|uniref:Sialyltransferase-like protein 4 n=1 Tax=Panicum miliaceum TaxID=4540 RepID=A0A3L6RNK4_PANMI|nr:sialyltransferase-like protein 4 [Panicum miliaceum]
MEAGEDAPSPLTTARPVALHPERASPRVAPAFSPSGSGERHKSMAPMMSPAIRVLPLALAAAIFSGVAAIPSTSPASPHDANGLGLKQMSGKDYCRLTDPNTGQVEGLSFEFNLCEAVASWEQFPSGLLNRGSAKALDKVVERPGAGSNDLGLADLHLDKEA